jgi:hypothetical protein
LTPFTPFNRIKLLNPWELAAGTIILIGVVCAVLFVLSAVIGHPVASGSFQCAFVAHDHLARFTSNYNFGRAIPDTYACSK